MSTKTDQPEIGFNEDDLNRLLEELDKESNRVYTQIYGRDMPPVRHTKISILGFLEFLRQLNLLHHQEDMPGAVDVKIESRIAKSRALR